MLGCIGKKGSADGVSLTKTPGCVGYQDASQFGGSIANCAPGPDPRVVRVGRIVRAEETERGATHEDAEVVQEPLGVAVAHLGQEAWVAVVGGSRRATPPRWTSSAG